MPRPTAAQLVYGSATVICTTLALLLLSGTESGLGVALAAVTALALGLLVAVRLPQAQQGQTATGRAAHPRHTAHASAARTHHALDGVGARQRVAAGRSSQRADQPAGEHSLRR
ncbi:hypothetical protein [Streptomyces sp. NPDC007346]|uniref:hypothetical protein n=1 Tax=Streptomyces sp. NPDC007346 TaxID=3154682 RepID=UPI0034522267